MRASKAREEFLEYGSGHLVMVYHRDVCGKVALLSSKKSMTFKDTASGDVNVIVNATTKTNKEDSRTNNEEWWIPPRTGGGARHLPQLTGAMACLPPCGIYPLSKWPAGIILAMRQTDSAGMCGIV
jgi:hypothetical protein